MNVGLVDSPESVLIWNPISTAPKDGTLLLLAQLRGDTDIIDNITVDIGLWTQVESGDWEAGTQGFDGWSSAYGHIEEPTHWLPFPRRC